jgi:hypothetical protein
VTEHRKGWLASRFARLSTGGKMLLILGLAFLPLGLIALYASLRSAAHNMEQRREDTLARFDAQAQRINAALSRSAVSIDTASAAIAAGDGGPELCRTTLQRVQRGPGPARYALYGARGVLRCTSPGYAPPARVPASSGRPFVAEIDRDGSALRLYVFGSDEVIDGIAEYPREGLADLAQIRGVDGEYDLELRQGDRRMVLRDEYESGTFVQTVRGSDPVADGQLQLSITLGAIPVRLVEMLLILLPVLMWLMAALIGWLIVDRLLLRPLVRVQRAVAAYKPGDRHLDLPRLTTPAREIGELGSSFDSVAQTVARHEAELEAAVERQTRLVREVHHRVKNNLQVVASLLNLHARGAASEDVAAAYASIQRRVDALAVVHRNHYAELEENRGVALKPLVSELAANLRGTAPPSAAGMTIRLDLEPFYATQDVALSVAFLVTEVAEFAMFCGAASVQVSLADANEPGLAQLVLESDSLRGTMPCDEKLAERFERIVTGLSRQLRSSMERDTETGRYALHIAVVDKAERG